MTHPVDRICHLCGANDRTFPLHWATPEHAAAAEAQRGLRFTPDHEDSLNAIRAERQRWCGRCLLGDHQLCVGISCRCTATPRCAANAALTERETDRA